MGDDTRLLALERALAHAERAIADLSDLARDQQAQIDGLKRHHLALRATLERLADSPYLATDRAEFQAD